MNNQMNSRLTVNGEGVQRMIDNNSAMCYTKQEEWKKWCLEQRFSDGEIVTDQKLSYFLAEYAMKRGRKLRRNPDGTPIALGRQSVLAYVKTIADMYSKQKALGLNPHSPARGSLVRAFCILSKKKRSRVRGKILKIEKKYIE
ncbi:hypothetical protein RMATCC62417_07046 [Rhizopus microsporus]|nr:hypothetical protein RMATCC62417_07046 [Rhizopus microsporus]